MQNQPTYIAPVVQEKREQGVDYSEIDAIIDYTQEQQRQEAQAEVTRLKANVLRLLDVLAFLEGSDSDAQGNPWPVCPDCGGRHPSEL